MPNTSALALASITASGKRPASHRNDPTSSTLAAERHATKAATNEALVLLALKDHPGATAGELAPLTGIVARDQLQEVRRRLSSMLKAGLVRQGDVRPCREIKARTVTWWPAGPQEQRELF